jgi:hypothetical protein
MVKRPYNVLVLFEREPIKVFNMKELSQREAAFAVHITTIGSDTFGDGKNSAIAAGYSDRSAHVAASRLPKRDKAHNRILELHSENMQRNRITTDKVLADLEHDKIMARKHHQYAVAKGCTELQGKYLAMFTDRLQTEQSAEQKELTAKQAEATQRLTKIALRDYRSGQDGQEEQKAS